MVAEPSALPKTTPDEEPTAAIEVALLLQVPPVVGLLSAVVLPRHTPVLPVIDVRLLTVTVVLPMQPAVVVKVMAAVPAATPVTTPPLTTVAIEVLPLLQAPPPTLLLSVVVRLMHICFVPVIDGKGFTVTYILIVSDR